MLKQSFKLWLNETRKMLWNHSAWITLLVGVGVVVLVLGTGYARLAQGKQFPALEATLGLSQIAGLVFVVLIGTWMAQEYNWRTLPLLLSRGVQRVPWLLSRVGAALLPLLLAMAIPFGMAWVIEIIYSPQVPELMRRAEADLLWLFGKLVLGMLPYLALALLLGVLTRSVALAVGVPLFSALIAENLLDAFWPQAAQYLPTMLKDALLQTGNLEYAAGLAGYTILFVMLATLRLRTQDLGG